MSVKRGIGKFLSGLIAVPVAIVIVVFAIANRQPVRVDLWPLAAPTDLPLSVVLMAAAVGGFLFGALVHWAISAKLRWRLHQATRRAEDAERELAALRSRQHPTPSDPQLPALSGPADVA